MTNGQTADKGSARSGGDAVRGRQLDRWPGGRLGTRAAEWVEQAIREALLATIPQRDGGLKVPRGAVRAERSEELEQIRGAQSELFRATCDGQE
jgi:hypothetical protein